MGPHVGLVLEGLVTDVADVGPVPGVAVHVGFQVVLVAEGAAAEVTVVTAARVVVRVNVAHMCHQVTLEEEDCVAFGALGKIQ